ncbi:unnamed protein product, partial [Rotaria magnacalcarata]
MDVPDEIDLSSLRATGLLPGETPMPDDHEKATLLTREQINENLLEQLVS